MKEKLRTPGERLRFFADTYFPSIAEFAEKIGYKKPSSLYGYFDGKEIGILLLDRIYNVGGNPLWVRWGVGDIFSPTPAGEILRRKHSVPQSFGDFWDTLQRFYYSISTSEESVRRDIADKFHSLLFSISLEVSKRTQDKQTQTHVDENPEQAGEIVELDDPDILGKLSSDQIAILEVWHGRPILNPKSNRK